MLSTKEAQKKQLQKYLNDPDLQYIAKTLEYSIRESSDICLNPIPSDIFDSFQDFMNFAAIEEPDHPELKALFREMGVSREEFVSRLSLYFRVFQTYMATDGSYSALGGSTMPSTGDNNNSVYILSKMMPKCDFRRSACINAVMRGVQHHIGVFLDKLTIYLTGLSESAQVEILAHIYNIKEDIASTINGKPKYDDCIENDRCTVSIKSKADWQTEMVRDWKEKRQVQIDPKWPDPIKLLVAAMNGIRDFTVCAASMTNEGVLAGTILKPHISKKWMRTASRGRPILYCQTNDIVCSASLAWIYTLFRGINTGTFMNPIQKDEVHGFINPEDPLHLLILVAALVSSTPLDIDFGVYQDLFNEIKIWEYEGEEDSQYINLSDIVFAGMNPLYKPRDREGNVILSGRGCKSLESYMQLFVFDDMQQKRINNSDKYQILKSGMFNFQELAGEYERAKGIDVNSKDWLKFMEDGFAQDFKYMHPIVFEFNKTRDFRLSAADLLALDISPKASRYTLCGCPNHPRVLCRKCKHCGLPARYPNRNVWLRMVNAAKPPKPKSKPTPQEKVPVPTEPAKPVKHQEQVSDPIKPQLKQQTPPFATAPKGTA